ncbi:leucine-rich repeat protein [Saccharicrinis aurantiacus]|uniref:leucine-rich repeat protein n=1 Tax=Saccharicrinis aurantiacus TaxID=1849719 RepID=UPI002491C953|nr:leucine-rich repeat protein [Saccharicrinis aurantiacus]
MKLLKPSTKLKATSLLLLVLFINLFNVEAGHALLSYQDTGNGAVLHEENTTTYHTLTKDEISITSLGVIHNCTYDFENKNIIIPNSIDGTTVKYIEEKTFYNKKIEAIILPESLIAIKTYAFAYNKITSLEIPDELVGIGASAFYNNSIASVKLGAGITDIGLNAFYKNKLTTVSIPDKVTKIGNSAFRENSLETISIPKNVEEIGYYAFANNQITSISFSADGALKSIAVEAFSVNKLQSLTIPSYIISIEKGAFKTNAIETLLFEENALIEKIGEEAFSNNKISQVDFTNCSTLKEFDSYSFSGNNLQDLTFPLSTKVIGAYSFSSNQLASLVFSEGIDSIGVAAFNNNNITLVNGEASNGLIFKRTKDYQWDNSTVVSYGGSSKLINFLPAQVKTIAQEAFASLKITELSLPSAVEVIESKAFYENDIAVLQLPSKLNFIGNWAFRNNQLSTVTIPKSVTTIGDYTFAFNNIEALNFEDYSLLDRIGSYTFYSNDISEVTLPSRLTYIGRKAFYSNELSEIVFPADRVIPVCYWKGGSSTFEIGESTTDLSNYYNAYLYPSGVLETKPQLYPAGFGVNFVKEEIVSLDENPDFKWDLKMKAWRIMDPETMSYGGRPVVFLYGDESTNPNTMGLNVSESSGVELAYLGFDNFKYVTADMQKQLKPDGVFPINPDDEALYPWANGFITMSESLLFDAYDTQVIGGRGVRLPESEAPVYLIKTTEGKFVKWQHIERQGGGHVPIRWYVFSDDEVEPYDGAPTGFDDKKDEAENLRIYPNPAQNSININVPYSNEYIIRILSMSGQCLQSYQMAADKSIKLDVSSLKQGSYMVSLQSSNGISSQIFIKK